MKRTHLHPCRRLSGWRAVPWIVAGSAMLLAAPCSMSAERAEVTLNNGEKIVGDLLENNDESVVMMIVINAKTGKTGKVTLPKSNIADLVISGDPRVEYATKKNAATTPEAHMALATWCRDKELVAEMIEQAILADTSAKDGWPAAAALLTGVGQVKTPTGWKVEKEWLKSQGKERYKGEVMTIAEADTRRKTDEAAEAQQRGATTVQTSEAAIARYQEALTRLNAQRTELAGMPAKITAMMTEVQAKITAAQALIQKAEDARRAMVAAQPPANNDPKNPVDPRQQREYDAARQAYEAARRAADPARAELPNLNATLAARKADAASVPARLAECDRQIANTTQLIASERQRIADAQAKIKAAQDAAATSATGAASK